MFSVETYTDRYFLDIVKLVENFHKESLGEYDEIFDPHALIQTIQAMKDTQAQNAFLLVVNGSCQGILAGAEYKSMMNGKRIFQEIIWYVNVPFRRYGVALLKHAQNILKSNGISIMIMAVMENSKTEKIKSFYERLGFKPMEVHFMKDISNGAG